MAILSKGQTFADGDQVTSTKLNNLVDAATFVSGSSGTTDDATLQVNSGGRLEVKTIQTGNIANSAVTTEKIADGAVTQAKASNMLLPAGAIMAFAMNGAPTGWLSADGSAVSRTTYANLFAAIGTTYGAGDGSTTFALPDLRGYFVRGTGTNSDGTTSGTFAVKQQDALQNITGRVATFANGTSLGGNWHVEPQNASGAFYTSSSGGSMTTGGGGAGTGYLHVDFAASRVARTSTETRPANIAMLYCIKI
jgi:hypothetical protein